ncbi:MAG: SprT-like domain-containing protein [Bacteroidales bacterium]|nr:SprT-like domain-containing protein [Bacteroidales bacterium]
MLKNEYIDILEKYFPKNAILPASELLEKNPVKLFLTFPRKTKKGTFVFTPGKALKITLNRDLKHEEMLLVFLHEMAHYITFKHHGRRIKPHGVEWQTNFLSLIDQYIRNGGFSVEAAKMLMACYFTPVPRYRPNCRYLRNYFYPESKKKSYLHQLLEKEKFTVAKQPNKQFILVKKRRTQYLCKNLVNGKLYLVHSFIEIKRLYE